MQVTENMSCVCDIYNRNVFDEDVEGFLQNLLFFYICQRCKEDGFDLTLYQLHEIPYSDENGQMWNFVNREEYQAYHVGKDKTVKISSIDFFVHYNGHVEPLYLQNDGIRGFCQKNKLRCQDAISYESN